LSLLVLFWLVSCKGSANRAKYKTKTEVFAFISVIFRTFAHGRRRRDDWAGRVVSARYPYQQRPLLISVAGAADGFGRG